MMTQEVYNWINTFQSRFFSPTCVLCGAAGVNDMDLCPGCLGDLPRNTHACARCALPLPASAPENSMCGACQRHPPLFDRCFAPYRYEGALPHLVTGLKFHARMHSARLLGKLLYDALMDTAQPLPEMVIPVPLHRGRMRERGFNQALEIARVSERLLDVPLDDQSVERHAATSPQSGLDARKRRRNIRGAFIVKSQIRVRHVALLDDVVTTGSTVTELAKTLKRSGVECVDVWAVARTP
jgi:ComF family protein